jgi:5-methylcytosine-specific restriction endonuclease McrA
MDSVREPLREGASNNRCLYCEKSIGQEADIDHLLPWARHPDNGIENLVVADSRCNNDKRDFLRNDAFVAIAAWLDKYHTERPHSALGYSRRRSTRPKLAA